MLFRSNRSLKPLEEYQARLTRWSAELEQQRRVQQRMGNARLVLGVALAAAASAALGPVWMSAWWLLAPAVPLAVLIALHPRTSRAVARATRAAGYYEQGVARIEGRWIGRGNPGDGVRDAKHIYAEDLDLFGRGSLFERISTARTATDRKSTRLNSSHT